MLLRATHFPDALTHGFTTRHGGVSTGVYASLNMGGKWGDDPNAVRENYRRVAEAGGFSARAFVQVRQVHSATVIRARDVSDGAEADAIWHARADGSGVVVAVLTADCVPILLADDEGSVVAAVHSGWRGTVLGVTARAVETLVEAGARAERLRAAIGPCIELDAFEVGDEVADQFDPAFVRRPPGARPHVDLVAAVRQQLLESGLEPGQIQRVGGCTHAERDRFFSYRRDAYGRDVKTGQQLSFIGFA